ncbi:unnamed protein product [Chrysoparadoxa australica]
MNYKKEFVGGGGGGGFSSAFQGGAGKDELDTAFGALSRGLGMGREGSGGGGLYAAPPLQPLSRSTSGPAQHSQHPGQLHSGGFNESGAHQNSGFNGGGDLLSILSKGWFGWAGNEWDSPCCMYEPATHLDLYMFCPLSFVPLVLPLGGSLSGLPQPSFDVGDFPALSTAVAGLGISESWPSELSSYFHFCVVTGTSDSEGPLPYSQAYRSEDAGIGGIPESGGSTFAPPQSSGMQLHQPFGGSIPASAGEGLVFGDGRAARAGGPVGSTSGMKQRQEGLGLGLGLVSPQLRGGGNSGATGPSNEMLGSPLDQQRQSGQPQPQLQPGQGHLAQQGQGSEQSQAEQRVKDSRYSLRGILNVIRMTDPDLNMLALGSDLTKLGLNLDSVDVLYATFASPWADAPSSKEPQFQLPLCYYLQPPALKTTHFSKFQLETLFYIFYAIPQDVLQAYAAQELCNREWQYHGDLKVWVKRAGAADGTVQPGVHLIYFDHTCWEKRGFAPHVQNDVRDHLNPYSPILP